MTEPESRSSSSSGEADRRVRPDDSHDEPRVRAIKRDDQLWRMGKRDLLKAVALGGFAGAAASVPGCSRPNDEGDDAIPPFVSGGTTYRLIDLHDYNAKLPPSGASLTATAYVESDFYFRSFNDAGSMTLDRHESGVGNEVALEDLKIFAKTLAEKGTADASEQTRFVELVTQTVAEPSDTVGRRMQGGESHGELAGRRMQGTTDTGEVSGRRMQGAEGRVEAGSEPRNLGTLVVDKKRYEDARVMATYTDGHTLLSHAHGSAVVRTEALPQLVQMQLPVPVVNPNPVPTALPRGTTTRGTPSSSGSSTRTRTSHYWRPN